MTKKAVQTADAPAAIGPYSQAIRAGASLYCSGQLGLDPATGELVAGGVGAEARRALENLRAVVSAAGGSLDDVVRTTIYLVDLADFAAVNAIYAEFFNEPYPSRVTIGAAALPKSGRVEIDALAIIDARNIGGSPTT